MKKMILQSLIISTIFLGCDSGTEQHSTLYEDAENTLSSDWHTVSGNAYPYRISAYNGSDSCVNLPVTWYKDSHGDWKNPHEYYLTLNNHNSEHILELDVGGTGMVIPHYLLGVTLDTKYGKRTLAWDSFYNHSNITPSYTEHTNNSVTMVFPSPVELVRGFDYEKPTTWLHFKVDIEEYLHQFEPDNVILSIERFIATGGNLDNIKLSSR